MSDLLVYEYQPTDENDFPIGNKQVFKYTTLEDLRDQITQSNIHLLRKLRQVTKENRLSRFKEEKPAEVEPMTDEDLRVSIFALRAERAAENFVRLTPEFYKCQENTESIFAWIEKHRLSPIDTESYNLAYQDLSLDNLLILGPAIPRPVPAPVVEPVAIEPVVAPPLPPPVLDDQYIPYEPPTTPHIVETIPDYHPEPVKPPVAPEPRATPGVGGLNRNVADGEGQYRPTASGSDISYTLTSQKYNEKNELVVTGQQTLYGKQALDAMPPDEYKKRLIKEPGFAAKVDKAEKDAAEAKLAARRAAMGRF